MVNANDSSIDDLLAQAAAGEISPEKENREHLRFKVNFKVYIKLSDGDIVQARAIDLSMGGLFAEYGANADIGKEFDMAFDLPYGEESKRVFARAKVVRASVVAKRNAYCLAFIFTSFGKKTDKILENYIELLSSKS